MKSFFPIKTRHYKIQHYLRLLERNTMRTVISEENGICFISSYIKGTTAIWQIHAVNNTSTFSARTKFEIAVEQKIMALYVRTMQRRLANVSIS